MMGSDCLSDFFLPFGAMVCFLAPTTVRTLPSLHVERDDKTIVLVIRTMW